MSSHVPAWKRLGLKLKGPASGEAIPSSGGPNAGPKPSAPIPSAHQTRPNASPASALKRKLPSSTPAPNAAGTPNKKQRREDTSANQGTPSSLKKSVSFADGTKDSAADKKTTEKKKPKKKKAKKPAATPKSDFSLEPSLHYLRQWHTARASWKFNKNHQTLLIKYVFDEDKLPSSDITIFYEYIRDLKGFVRTRLRETAAEIRQKDMEAGAGAFPATLTDKEARQKEYEETISRFLQDLQQHHQQQQQQTNGKASKNANGKRTLDEVEYVLRVATPEVKHRLMKRIRAERVLDELSSSDSEESTTSAASAGTTTSSTSSSSASSGQAATATTAPALNGVAARGRSDSSQQPAKRRRLRNVRTDIAADDDDDDDSSSSESESSDSESEEAGNSSSSESESEEGSEDEEMVDAAPGVGDAAESSSSSSSSSSSESSSDAESESEAESDAGEGGPDQESESGSSSSSDED